MARTQAPPSSAVRQTQYAADVITSQRGLHGRAIRHYSSGPHTRKQYFIRRAGQHPTPGNWQGIDPDLFAFGTHLGAPASVQEPRASQTLGLNTHQQRPARSQMAVLDASPPDPELGRAKAWAYPPGNPAELTGVQQDSLSAILQKALARPMLGQGYARMSTEYIRQTEAAPPVVPDDVRQHWKNVFVSYARTSQVAGVSTPAGETVDLVKYLLSRNVAQTTPALPADIERGYYQRIAELELAAQEEGYAASNASQQDFWAFVRAHASWCQADLILTDEGCLCAIWYTEDDTRVEVEFLGDGQGKLLVFGNRGSSLIVVPDITTADLDTIGRKISGFTFVSVAG